MRFLLTLILALTTTQTMAQTHPKNRLANEASPYLQQHADNPVDWYPWGEEALEKARSEGKMIFVSVGYSSCHWCHVMEEESFENKEIAEFLNKHFVSIKIDRERRPDLDEQFILVTSALTGSAGWPNSVFMTPDAEPFFAGTYFPPNEFQNILDRIAEVWRADREALMAEAFAIANNLRNYLDQTAALGEITSEDINAAATSLLTDLDDFNGGFGNAPKFPRESMLLFLMDQATRRGDSTLLEAVTLTLDGMIKGGIHDHIGGGFHRYSIDPEWHVPHFEKMLYNQALVGRLLLRAYSATGRQDYARAATRTFDYVLRDMRAPGGAFYGAEDADSLDANGAREEGAFYAWTPAEMRAVLGADADTMIGVFDVVEQGIFEGSNVLRLSELPLDVVQEMGVTGAAFDAGLEVLRLARAGRAAPIKDAKIILAWNGEMIATLAEAGRVLGRADYAQAAEEAVGFILENMRVGDGLKRIWYEDHADVAAQLVDFAALGHALLALYDYGDGDVKWLAMADQLATEMLALFGDADQAMRMTADAAGLGPFRPLDDNELPSGNALALALLDGLDRRLARVGEAAPRLAAALAIDAINNPGGRAAILTALEVQQGGASGAMRVSNGGAVRVFATADRAAGVLNLQVQLRDGWHINAHEPLEDYLIGIALSVADQPLSKADYPEAEIKELGFSETPLSLYEQGFTLSAPLVVSGDGPMRAQLTLQACNDEVCLPPDEMIFWIW